MLRIQDIAGAVEIKMAGLDVHRRVGEHGGENI